MPFAVILLRASAINQLDNDIRHNKLISYIGILEYVLLIRYGGVNCFKVSSSELFIWRRNGKETQTNTQFWLIMKSRASYMNTEVRPWLIDEVTPSVGQWWSSHQPLVFQNWQAWLGKVLTTTSGGFKSLFMLTQDKSALASIGRLKEEADMLPEPEPQTKRLITWDRRIYWRANFVSAKQSF